MSRPENHGTAGAEQYPSGIPVSSPPRVLEIQRQHPDEYLNTMQAIHHDTQRRFIHALVHGRGDATYREIRQLANVSQRTLRKHAKKLEEMGLVERIHDFMTLVRVVSQEVLVLLEHALECYYDASP